MIGPVADLAMRAAALGPIPAAVRCGIVLEQRSRGVLESTRSRPRSRPCVHYHHGGAGDALMLLNGWTASGAVWPTRWLAQLEDRFHVIRPDNRGSGWSRAAPRPFTIADLADDVVDVLHDCGAARARVLGLSMGGVIAQELALRHPCVVQHLALVGTRPPAPAAIGGDPRLLLKSLRGRRPGQDLADYHHATWARLAAPGFAATNPDVMAELVAQIVGRVTPRQGKLDQSRALLGWSGAGRLRGLTMPTTVIHGSLDPLIPVDNARRLAALIPAASLHELPGVGHLVAHEAGAALTEVLVGETG